MNQEENFHQMLRDIIPKIQEARINVLKSEANLKKIFWIQLCQAKDDGERSYNAQKSKAEATEDYYKASMNVAVAKANLDALQTEKSAVDMQFEEWRTKMANLRVERDHDMVLKGRAPNKAEKEWMDSISQLGCIVCLHFLGQVARQRSTILTGRLKPGAIFKQFPFVLNTIVKVLTMTFTHPDIHSKQSL